MKLWNTHHPGKSLCYFLVNLLPTTGSHCSNFFQHKIDNSSFRILCKWIYKANILLDVTFLGIIFFEFLHANQLSIPCYCWVVFSVLVCHILFIQSPSNQCLGHFVYTCLCVCVCVCVCLCVWQMHRSEVSGHGLDIWLT